MSVPGDKSWADQPSLRQNRGQLERLVNGALASAIHAHGPITQDSKPSATKRILGALEPFLNEEALAEAAGAPKAKGWRASKEWRESCPRCGERVTTVAERVQHYAEAHNIPPAIDGDPMSLTARIQRALLRRHPVTLAPDRARNYAEIAAYIAKGGA